MSTLKVSSIQSPSTTAGGLSISATGAVSGGLPVPNRNLLYNGAMQVAQRGTSTAGITAQTYNTADRWQTVVSSLGTWTQSVENDAPTGSGIRKSLKMLCTTANTSPGATAEASIRQTLEGQDIQRVAKGTASALHLTLSFWVKSNVTGTYIARLYDADNTRSVSASYSVSASATWERKTITFPADTTGAFDNDNSGSLLVDFALAAGSNLTSGTLATSWATYVAANTYVGQTNLAAAVNNYWQITGVQLETGPVATEFEHRSFGDELARCQRYFQRLGGTVTNERIGTVFLVSSTGGYAVMNHAVPMRAATSHTRRGTVSVTQPAVAAQALTSSSDSTMGPLTSEISIGFATQASFAQGEIAWLTTADGNASIDVSAEL